MTLTAPATPWLAKVPLGADGQAHALLIVHADQAIAPTPALRADLKMILGPSAVG